MKKALFAAALAAACGVASAQAQGYAGVLAGLANISTDCAGMDTCKASSMGAKLYAGYEVMPHLSVEVAYTDFGKVRASLDDLNEQYRANAISVVAAYRHSFRPDVIGVARLGLARVKAHHVVEGLTNKSDLLIRPYVGLGLDYQIREQVKVVGIVDMTSAKILNDTSFIYLLGIGAEADF